MLLFSQGGFSLNWSVQTLENAFPWEIHFRHVCVIASFQIKKLERCLKLASNVMYCTNTEAVRQTVTQRRTTRTALFPRTDKSYLHIRHCAISHNELLFNLLEDTMDCFFPRKLKSCLGWQQLCVLWSGNPAWTQSAKRTLKNVFAFCQTFRGFH